MGDDGWDGVLAQEGLGDLAELVLAFGLVDTMDGEAAQSVVQHTENFVGLLNLDDVHQTGWEAHFSADLSVDLDELLLADGAGFIVGQSVTETVAQEEDQRQAFTELVWARGWARGKGTSKLGQHPVFWSG